MKKKNQIFILVCLMLANLFIGCQKADIISGQEDDRQNNNPAPAAKVSAAPADQFLYGHDNTNSNIIKIDTATGLATIVGPITFNTGASGMATSRGPITGPAGEIYASGTHFGLLRDKDELKDYVTAIDLITGQGIKVVQTSREISGRGIAFGDDGVTLYLMENYTVSTIDIATGAVTEVGPTGLSESSVSLEYCPDHSDFLAIAGVNLIQVDPGTGSAVTVAANIDLSACTIARSPTGTWYSVDTRTKNLVSIDHESGAVTVIGNLGAASSSSVCGTAFAEERPLTLELSIDVKPTSCPNPLNPKSKGVIPVAILGTDVFDVADIDVASVNILGVYALRHSYEDVGTPHEFESEDPDENDCTEEGADGFTDLSLKFKNQDVIAALEADLGAPLERGDVLLLPVSGLLNDGTSFVGVDVIIIR